MPTFKSKDLNTATSAIYDAYHKLNATQAETFKTVSVILARVERKQAYKADGFKSLEEYAEQIGIKKSKAHKMENAGRLLDSKDEAVRNFANASDYSKLAIISSAEEADIKSAIDSGKLKPEFSQKEVRAWKEAYNAASAKPKVVPTWHITGMAWNDEAVSHIDVTIGIQNPKDWAREYDSALQCVTVKLAEDTVYLAANATGLTLRYTATKVAQPKTKTPKAVKFLDPKAMTDEQLAAMIAEYNARRSKEEEG